MVIGAQASYNELIVFLDADLIEFRPKHILSLIEPVRIGAYSMSIGIFTDGRRQTDLSHRLILSGQRCLRWSLFQSAPDLAATRWGVEIALSLHTWRNGYNVLTVPWRGVTHVMRPEKTKGVYGYWSHVQMWLDIVRYLVRHLIGGRRRYMKWMHYLRT